MTALVANTYDTFTPIFDTFTILDAIVGAVVIGIMVLLVLKYRDNGTSSGEPEDAPSLGRLPPERGKAKTIVISLTLSTIVLSVLVFGTFGAIDNILNPPQQGTLDITVYAFQWGWRFIYPNGHDVTGELRVPVGRPVKLIIVSDDVFHNLGIVEFKIKRDAIPGRVNMMWFEAKETGEYDIRCFELCGIGHAFMTARLLAMEPRQFDAWYSNAES